MQRDQRSRGTTPKRIAGSTVLALALLSAIAVDAQFSGAEGNTLALEKAAIRGCPGCDQDSPKLLISSAAAAIRIDLNDAGDALSVQVIPLKASEMSVSQLKVDGVDAQLEEGAWRVTRDQKMKKKAPRIEMILGDGQVLSFKPQHRPYQGPVGGLIMPKKDEQPERDLSFHKKSFWADSLG